jgi:hypothetical protein
MDHGKSARALVVGHRDDGQFHAAVVFADINQPIANSSRAPGMAHGGEDVRVADAVAPR